MGAFGGAGGMGGSGLPSYNADRLIEALERRLQKEIQAFEKAEDPVAVYSVRSQLGYLEAIRAKRKDYNSLAVLLVAGPAISSGDPLV